jgi:hypothetical protein
MSKLVHYIADCLDCGKRWEGLKDEEKARYHAKKTGHTVLWEKGYGGKYKTS